MRNRKISYAVITKVPGKYEEGNEYDRFVEASDIRTDMSYPKGKCIHFPESFIIKDTVFELGEIMVLNEYGREISGRQRKPGKWYVDYKEFDDIKKAIRCARDVMRKEEKEEERRRGYSRWSCREA